MSVSTHVYTAFVLGSPDVELDVQTGTVTLDSGSSPHVTADLTITTPDPAVIEALDPRGTARVRIVADAAFPVGAAQHREFDLGVRDITASSSDAELSLRLASDEALLTDYGPLSDDLTPLSLQSSLRAVVNYVLDECVPGAVLEPGADVDATAYWDASNLIPNPSFEVDVSNWGVGGGATGLLRVAGGVSGGFCGRWTTTAAGTSDIYPSTGLTSYSARPGVWYSFGTYLQSPIPRTAHVVMRFYSAAMGLLSETHGDNIVTPGAGWLRATVTAQAPTLTRYVFVYITTVGNTAAGQFHFTDAAILTEGRVLPAFFDGSTPDTSSYNYEWTGAANASSSTRRTLINAPSQEALIWDAGLRGIEFLTPLVQSFGLRLVCDESRSWTLRDENYIADGSLSVSYGVNMLNGDDTISRDDDSWYDAAFVVYTWKDSEGNTLTRSDSFALTTPYTRLRRFDIAAPYPGPGFASYVVRRAQGRGREVSASVVSDWRTKAEQPVTIDIENGPAQTGAVQSVTFDLRSDEMTVSTRTTDTPATAYIIGPVGASYLDVPVGISYEEFDWSLV